MSGLRRSARSQILRNPRYPEDHGHVDPYANQTNEVAQGMIGMGFGNMGAGYHPPSDMGYYNAAATYHQYHQNPGYSHYQNTHHQYQHPHQHQYPTHHGFIHHAGDVSQTAQEDPHSTSSSGRTLRARNTGGAVASSSSAIFNPLTHGGNARGKRTAHGSSSATAGSSYQFPPTPGGNIGQDSGGEEDVRDEEDGNSNAIEGGSSTKSRKGPGMESSLTLDQMVQNCLYYLLLMQHKKVPVKRSDLVKNAMNSQHKQFPEVIKKLETSLKDVFGMTLVRLEKGKDNNTTTTGMGRNPAITAEETEEANSSDMKAKGKGGSSESYILISKFPSSVCDSVTKRDPEVDSKKTVLYLVLATIFMLNRAVDEEVIWKIILEMQLDQMVCEKKSDLRKFLKSEFVSSGYLNIELTAHNSTLSKYNSNRSNENNNNNDKPGENEDVVSAKYSWGPRAHMEYSKYSMLKFVTNRFPGRRPYEFTVQYSMLSKAEKALAEKDLGDGRDSDPDNDTATASGESGSAIQIKQKKGGKGETYFIDGENTETETEET